MTVKEMESPIDAAPPHDPDVEGAVIALLLVSGRPGLFDKLDAADFYNPLHKFLFSELRLMAESGEPQGDVHAITRWLRQPAALRRSDGLLKREDVGWTVAEAARVYATIAHEGFYLTVLAKERIKRGLLAIARGVEQHLEAVPLDPMATLDWLQTQTDLLTAKSYDLLPEEIR